MPWYALARSHDGYLRWTFDNWRSDNPLDLREGAFTAGDFSFVYRSSNYRDMTLIPSIRSELLRDRIEDYEKVQVLRKAPLQCGEEELMSRLRETIETFSSKVLVAGQADELVTQARAQLREISGSVIPHICANSLFSNKKRWQWGKSLGRVVIDLATVRDFLSGELQR